MREQFRRIGVWGTALAVLTLTLVGCEPRTATEFTGVVTRVIDGDTIDVEGLGTVRYIGIDTPELHHPRRPLQRLARRAHAFNTRLVLGRTARIVFGAEPRDAHGRVLGDVFVDGLFVNLEMVRRGLGRTLTIRPNTRHASRLHEAQRMAMAARRGLWGRAEGGPPWGIP